MSKATLEILDFADVHKIIGEGLTGEHFRLTADWTEAELPLGWEYNVEIRRIMIELLIEDNN